MADIRLITILPQQPVPGVPQAPVPQGGGNATTISSLPPGTVLSGFIVNRDAGGNPILRTDAGDIHFESQFFLKIGSEVQIRIQQNAGHTLAHILSVNGQPPEVAEAQSAFAQEPDILLNNASATPRATTAQSATPATIQNAAPPVITFSATLLTAPPEDVAAPVPAGSQLTLKIITINVAGQNTPAETAPDTFQAGSNPALYSAYTRSSPSTPLPQQTTLETAQPAVPQPTITPNQPAAPATTTPTPQIPAATQTAPSINAPFAPVNSPALNSLIANVTPGTPAPVATTVTATPAAIPSVVTDEANVATPLVQNISPAAQAAPGTTPAAQSNLPSAPAYTAPQLGQTIQAVVIGHETSGEALLQTPVGVLRLQSGAILTAGTTLTVEIAKIVSANAQPLTPGQAATPAPITDLAQQWNSLQQIFSLLSGRDGLDGMTFAPHALPQITEMPKANPMNAAPKPDFSAGLLLFMTALRGGDFRNWLGKDNVQWLEERGHGALVDKATGEFSAMSRQFTNPPSGQWQTMFFPIAVEGELQQVRWFTKRDRKPSDSRTGAPEEDDTRFVVEMELTQLGQMQMDGFIRRQLGNMQFDLVVRSSKPLPQDVQGDILQIYQSTGELTGYRGNLVFQAGKTFPVTPMDDIIASHLGNVIA